MRKALVFGGTGQIGQPLVAGLLERGWQLHAVSRRPQPARKGLTWVRAELDAMEALPDAFDVIFSAGPLDLFARWYAGDAIQVPRVIAFGSTSLGTKRESPNAYERDLAARLETAEQTVFAHAAATGAHATLLRPTLVYGAGRDTTLTQIAELAQRLQCFPLPSGLTGGLRQPVHVDDLAAAALAVIDLPATFDRAYALPGGETLTYREMVARTLAAMSPPARLLELPAPLFRIAVGVAQRLGIARSLSRQAIVRMGQNLVFDSTPAREDFGYAPRGFAPAASMLGQ